jgi:5-methylcytosine-specific restriction endonuclease McrA
MTPLPTGRRCLREPIPEIADAARLLDAAVSAHLMGRLQLADELIRSADIPAIGEFGESLWGPKSPHRHNRAISELSASSHPKDQRARERAPNAATKRELLQRDGHHCRFCGIPVVRSQVRERIRKVYPVALRWGAANPQQHAAFQLMSAYADHVKPHARGGESDLANLVITCAGCNFGRGRYLLEEVGVLDPRDRDPVRSTWDGLERFQ